MPYRSTMPNRPWLQGATYDKYDTSNAVHYDLYAWESADGYVYFDVQCSERGKKPLARSVLRYAPEFDHWTECAALPLGLVPLQWRRETHNTFKRVHGRLLALCVIPAGYSVRHILAHYVKPYDADPWPRGTLNTYQAPVYGEGKRPGRPKRTVSEETQRAINILMGVDVLDII